MSEFNASNFKKEEGGQGPDIIGTTELTSPYFMVPPSGTTAQRPSGCAPGTLRFNTDIGSLEYFKGDTLGWESIVKTTPNLGGGTGSNTGTGARGLFGGSGDPSTGRGEILYITISTLGDSQIFGDLSSDKYATAGLGSKTRGVFAGGYDPSQLNTIEFVNFSSTGNVINFGDMSYVARDLGGLASSTRGLFFGGISTPGSPAGTNTIEYITIASEGNAVNFGDAHAAAEGMEGMASSTRGIISGGSNPSSAYNNISYVTIATTGDAADFGDMQAQRWTFGSGSNATRGIFSGGRTPAGGAGVDIMDYITIATLGNSSDFGNLTDNRSACDVVTSSTRHVTGGGYNPSNVNIIDYVEIMTTGDAVDFGDLTYARSRSGSCSNAHGGL